MEKNARIDSQFLFVAIARSAIGRLEPEEKLAVVGYIPARDRICCKYPLRGSARPASLVIFEAAANSLAEN
jgi:hypothetical protein